MKIHFTGAEVSWSQFPTQCIGEPPVSLLHSYLISFDSSHIINCVRSGYNIPNPYTNPGLDPISSRNYTEDVYPNHSYSSIRLE